MSCCRERLADPQMRKNEDQSWGGSPAGDRFDSGNDDRIGHVSSSGAEVERWWGAMEMLGGAVREVGHELAECVRQLARIGL
jgi:hypothetical protein